MPWEEIKAHSKVYNLIYLFIVSGMFVPFAILMMPLAKQTAEMASCKLGWCYPSLCGILYADEFTSVYRISCKYSDRA